MISCPLCNNSLVPVEAARHCLCPTCNRFFSPPRPDEGTARTSRRAIVSLLLGLLSIVGMFLTAIPAIILGAMALRDIGRDSRRLRGRGYAIAGIITAGIFGLSCGPMTAMVTTSTAIMIRSSLDTTQPAEMSHVAETMDVPAPPGFVPLAAEKKPVEAYRAVVYGNSTEDPTSFVFVLQIAKRIPKEMVNSFVRRINRSRNLGLADLEEEDVPLDLGDREITLRITNGRCRAREVDAERLQAQLTFPDSKFEVFWITLAPDPEQAPQRREQLAAYLRDIVAHRSASD